MYPRYYSTGTLTGRVLEKDTLFPVSNALVTAELSIEKYDAMSGGRSKRVAAQYSITDSQGRFNIPSMSTLYIFYAAIMQSRKASGYVTGVYHSDYKMSDRTNDDQAEVVWTMTQEANTHGLDDIKRHFTGWHRVKIRRADREAFRDILQAIHDNDPNPNGTELRLYKQLMR